MSPRPRPIWLKLWQKVEFDTQVPRIAEPRKFSRTLRVIGGVRS